MTLDPPGFFGKVPARGDFVGRRIATPLAGPWDTWLGTLTASVREAAGEDWPEAWLTAPLWHFALGPDLAPGPGAAGVLVASMDRVGRMFPFTILGPASGVPAEPWTDAVEALVLAALEDEFDPEQLDAALLGLGPPPPGEPLLPNQSLWRCRGSDRVPPTDRRIPGLPMPAECVAMVLGQSTVRPST